MADGTAVLSLGAFVIDLPEILEDRKHVLRRVGPWIRKQGYEVPKDIGQKYLYCRVK